jgi:TonB family protein
VLREPVRPARESALDRVPVLLFLAGAVVVSGAAHALVVSLASRVKQAAAAPLPPVTVKVAVVDRPPPPPLPAPVEMPGAPEAPPKRSPRPTTKHASPAPAPTPAPPTETPAPVPEAPAPPSNEPPLMMPGVALSATSTAGGLGIRAGGGGRVARGKGTGGDGSGDGGGEPGLGEIAPAYALTEEPVFLNNVSAAELQRYYPEAARKEHVEGVVRVKMLISDQGTVAKATLINDPTGVFSSAALKVARLYRFRPAKISGRKVATEIEFAIHFELNE